MTSRHIGHLNDVMKEAVLKITKENGKRIDEDIHHAVEVEYENCPDTWKAVKDQLANYRDSFI